MWSLLKCGYLTLRYISQQQTVYTVSEQHRPNFNFLNTTFALVTGQNCLKTGKGCINEFLSHSRTSTYYQFSCNTIRAMSY